jgi:hypothetical protein
MVKESNRGDGGGVMVAGLDAQRTLACRGSEMMRLKALAYPLSFFQTVKSGSGEKNSVDLALGEFAKARIHVAAEFNGHDVRAKCEQLRAAALAAGPNHGSLRQRVKAVIFHRDENVARIDTMGCSGKREGSGQFRRQIFKRVHGQVDTTFGEGFFNFLGEHSLGTDLREGDFLQTVAGGFDDLDFDRMAVAPQKRSNVVRLP